MRRPGFGVATLVLIAITAFGLLVKSLQPFLPLPRANLLSTETSDFLKQGSLAGVDWRLLTEETFAEALRTDKPFLLLIGTDWSQLGRYADRQVFSDPEVQTFLAKRFVCIRVDGAAMPEWAYAYLPLRRQTIELRTAFQIWVLDPRGELADYLSPSSTVGFTAGQFLSSLVTAYSRVASRYPGARPAGAMQKGDLEAMLTGGQAMPDVDAFAGRLEASIGESTGGFPSAGRQYLYPNAWRLLLETGRSEAFTRSFDPVIKSGVVDWLDGGFFRCGIDESWKSIEVDKPAVLNAEMMQLCTFASIVKNDRFLRLLADQAWECLTGELINAEGLVSACRKGDDGAKYRSRRSSFSVRNMRELIQSGKLTRDDGHYATNELGLAVERNPQMLIRVDNFDSPFVEGNRFTTVLRKLREFKQDARRNFNQSSYADVNAAVASKLLWVARATNDVNRRSEAIEFFDRLWPFLAGNDVQHELSRTRPGRPYLGDYAAMIDASLGDFLLSGRQTSFDLGLRLLDRAWKLFRADSGLWNVTTPTSATPWPPDTVVPPLLDLETESPQATVMRVLHIYGQMLCGRQDRDELAVRYSQEAVNIMLRYGEIAAEFNQMGSSFMLASKLTSEARTVYSVGPHALERANVLFAKRPDLIVLPVVGDVRSDLRTRKAGYYLSIQGEISGPLTLEALLSR